MDERNVGFIREKIRPFGHMLDECSCDVVAAGIVVDLSGVVFVVTFDFEFVKCQNGILAPLYDHLYMFLLLMQ